MLEVMLPMPGCFCSIFVGVMLGFGRCLRCCQSEINFVPPVQFGNILDAGVQESCLVT